MKSIVPVGQKEVIRSRAQNLTAITDNNSPVSHHHQAIPSRPTPTPPLKTDEPEANTLTTQDTSTCTQIHQPPECKHTESLLTQASELLTRPPLARFSKRIQVAFISHTGHSVSWATAPPLLLQLHLTALLWSPLHQCCSYRHYSGYRYIQHCGYIDSWFLLLLGCKCYQHLWTNK